MVKTHKKYQDYLLNPVLNTFSLDPTKTEEMQSYTNTLTNNKNASRAYQTNGLTIQKTFY